MKFLTTGTIENCPEVNNLGLPIPFNQGEKFLKVAMSFGKGKWSVIDFTDPQNIFTGIYTTGLSYCAAVSLIKKDKDGNILKIWMQHIYGGVIEAYMDSLPLELKNINLKNNESYQITVAYGTLENLEFLAVNHEKNKKILANIYNPEMDINADMDYFYTENDGAYHGQYGSFAITKKGIVGTAPDDELGFTFTSSTTDDRNTILAKFYNKKISQLQYENEKELFHLYISHAFEKEEGKKQNAKEIYSEILAIGNKNPYKAAEALHHTRNFLTEYTSIENENLYKINMKSMGKNWLKIGLGVISALGTPYAIHQIEFNKYICGH